MKSVTHVLRNNTLVDHVQKTVAILCLAFLCSQHAVALPTAGWLEHAHIMPDGFSMKAKLDTGADNSSINARKITTFFKDGSDWARFSVRNFEGDKLVIERPIIRTTTIKRHNGDHQDRPVIELSLCIDGIIKTVEVNLVDRSKLNYQLLIGRNFMRNSLLVDSAKEYILPDRCTHDLDSGGLSSDASTTDVSASEE